MVNDQEMGQSERNSHSKNGGGRKTKLTISYLVYYEFWSCQTVCDALSYILDNIYIRFGTMLYRHIVGIPIWVQIAHLS